MHLNTLAAVCVVFDGASRARLFARSLSVYRHTLAASSFRPGHSHWYTVINQTGNERMTLGVGNTPCARKGCKHGLERVQKQKAVIERTEAQFKRMLQATKGGAVQLKLVKTFRNLC